MFSFEQSNVFIFRGSQGEMICILLEPARAIRAKKQGCSQNVGEDVEAFHPEGVPPPKLLEIRVSLVEICER